jgi:glycosyl transferase family 25
MPAQPVPVFIISLTRATDRRESIGAHLKKLGVEFEFVDAVEGKAMPATEIQRLLAPGVSLSPGQVGCYLSHLEAYRRIVERQIPVALILEDDARLSPEAVKLLRSDLSDAAAFDYCFLDSENFNDAGPVFYDASQTYPIAAGFRAHPLSHGPICLHAVLVSREAARKRLEHAMPIREPIDMYEHLPYPITFLAILRPKLAWLGELGVVSSTFERHVPDTISWRFLKKSLWYYRLRDILMLKPLKWLGEVKAAQRQGRISTDRTWRRLPSGREVVTD